MVDTLEKGIQDLTLINAQAEISTEYTVNLIEEKVPRRILEKWLSLEREEFKKSKEADKTLSTEEEENLGKGAVRFKELIKFLKEERRQAERMIQLHGRDKDKENEKDKYKHKGNKDKY